MTPATRQTNPRTSNVDTRLLEPDVVPERESSMPDPPERPQRWPPDLSPQPAHGPLRRWRWWLLGAAAAALLLLAFLARRTPSEAPRRGEAQAIPVRATEVARGDLLIASSYAGELIGEVADIAPQVGGLLRDITVRIGDRVHGGQILATLDDIDLRSQFEEAKGQFGVADANRRRAEAELDRSQADHRRSADLYRENLISDQESDRVAAMLAAARASLAAAEAQVEQARARQAQLAQQLAETRVAAPFSGTVAARYLDRGALVQPGTPLLRLVEDGHLRVQFRAPERDLGALRSGVSFRLTTQATGSELFTGTVENIAGEVSRIDRTVLIEGVLAHSAELLRPGMYAEVQVQVQVIRGALLVPVEAVLERIGMDGQAQVGVFRVAEGSAQWVPVVVLGRSGGRAAVEAPLTDGDRVLTLGHTDLRDGSPIQVVGGESAGSSQPKVEG